MKRSGKNITDKGKSKNLKNPNKSNFNKVLVFIKKLSSRISLGLMLRRIIKTIFICLCFLVVTFFLFLLCRTKSPLSDVFTSGRISIFKNQPENITRNVVIDASHLSENGGVMTLTKSLVTDIAKKRPNWKLLVLVKENYKHMPDFQKSSNVKVIEITPTPAIFLILDQIFKINSLGIFHDKLIQLLYFDQIFCDDYCDLVWDPIGFYSYCNFVNIPRISTIHDVAFFDISPKFLGSDILHSRICMKNTILFSKKIITVSEFSQKRICDKFHVPKDFVEYIPIKLGTRSHSNADVITSKTTLNKYNLKSQKYFIFCSAWWKHKNHSTLIKAFNKFAQKNSDVKLILVGKHPEIFESRPIQEFFSDRIIIAGFVPDEELGILLKNALAFIHPSIYEGFGIPITEAMANGIPVACSNVASLPEVAGSAALLFDPFDTDSITEAMHRLASDPQLRKDLIKKGYEQAKKYSDRDTMVDEYIRIMEEVMRENDLRKAEKGK